MGREDELLLTGTEFQNSEHWLIDYNVQPKAVAITITFYLCGQMSKLSYNRESEINNKLAFSTLETFK